MATDVRKVLLNAVIDDFDNGEPIGYLIDIAREEIPSMSPLAIVVELRSAVDDGLMRVWLSNSNGSESTATDATYEAAIDSYRPNEGRSYIIEESLVASLTCRGRAVWRTFAEQWQLELSMDGRVVEDQPGELTIVAKCFEMARQLLSEWLNAHPDRAVEEPPQVEVANYALSPGFPETGKRVTWRLTSA